MNYEIVELKERTVAGISAGANLNSPESSAVIGRLWEQFYGGIYESLRCKVNDKTIGLYTDYQKDGGYKTMICAEVSQEEQSAETLVIPAGKYAKFIIKGNVVTAVQNFWTELCQMQLDRSFACDFEEYQGGGNTDNMEIHIYIALKNSN